MRNKFLLRIPKRKLSGALKTMRDIKTFVFLDMETTGLPHLEGNRTKITELCVVTVLANHLRLGVFPRVLNKLSFCFNPWRRIDDLSEKMTGLSNVLLEEQSKFSEKTVEMINLFLEHTLQPACFVAHNGNRFDYPILKSEVEKTGKILLPDIFYIDSLEAFRDLENSNTDVPDCSRSVEQRQPIIPVELSDGFDEMLLRAVEDYSVNQKTTKVEVDSRETVLEVEQSEKVLERIRFIQNVNETTPVKRTNNMLLITEEPVKKQKVITANKRLNYNVSYKLVDVYKRLTSKDPKESHQAEGDVILMLTCAATFGDRFVEWANLKAQNFADVKAMTPGRKLGT